MKKRLLFLIAPIIALILECLPYGVALNFAVGEYGEEIIRRTYSYFDLIPFGYATFGPLPAAALTCAVILLMLIYAFSGKAVLGSVAGALSVAAGVLSVSSALLGSLTVIGVIVTVLLIAEGVLLLLQKRLGTE